MESNGTLNISAKDLQYELFSEEFPELPWDPGIKPVKWGELRAAIQKQEPGVWVIYSGFPNEDELYRASAAVTKVGRTQRSVNTRELKLAVKVKPKEPIS